MEKFDTCETCGKGPFENESQLWNHPCPGRETTIQRAAKVIVDYEPLLDEDGQPQIDAESGKPYADESKPIFGDRPLPAIGEVLDREGGRHAKVVTAQVTNDGSQVIGLRYID